MTDEHIEKKPQIPDIDMDSVAFNFGDLMIKAMLAKKLAAESGEAVIMSAQGKFQFMDDDWSQFAPNPFHYGEEFQHALVICLNAVYQGQAEVEMFEEFQHDRVGFKAKVRWETVTYVVLAEAMQLKTGEMFYDVLQGMCDTVDKSGVLMEYKMPKLNLAKMSPDDKFPDIVFPKATPVTDSFKKLQESGVVAALANGLQKGCSVKGITASDAAKAISKFQNQMEKFDGHIKKLEIATMQLNENVMELEQKLKQTGGWIEPMMLNGQQHYADSGVLLAQKFPGIKELAITPCKCGRGSDTIHDIIIHLNDSPGHGKVHTTKKAFQKIGGFGETSTYEEPAWTREMIADWLETLDVKLELKED
jgi:hypothetical protein